MAVFIPSSGGKRIKDATALPNDVMKGKIFYNNDGRQVGTGEMIRVKSVILPEIENNKIDTGVDEYIRWRNYIDEERTDYFEGTSVSSSDSLKYNRIVEMKIGTLFGMELEGRYYRINASFETIFGVREGIEWAEIGIYEIGSNRVYYAFLLNRNEPNKIYVTSKSKSIEFFYSEETTKFIK